MIANLPQRVGALVAEIEDGVADHPPTPFGVGKVRGGVTPRGREERLENLRAQCLQFPFIPGGHTSERNGGAIGNGHIFMLERFYQDLSRFGAPTNVAERFGCGKSRKTFHIL